MTQSALITNPLAAFGQSSADGVTGAIYQEYKAGAAITRGQLVKLVFTSDGLSDDTNTPDDERTFGEFTIEPAADANDNVIGVAYEAIASGLFGKVVVLGPALAQTADADIATDTWVQATTAGRYTTVTDGGTTPNVKTVGYTLQATVAASAAVGDLRWIYVSPSIIPDY